MSKSRRRIGAAAAALLVFMALWVCAAGSVSAAEDEPAPADKKGAAVEQAPEGGEASSQARYDLSIAVAISIGFSTIGAGYAVGRVGAAALGAASENPEILGRSLLFVALAEGIAIYGLLMGVLLWIKIP